MTFRSRAGASGLAVLLIAGVAGFWLLSGDDEVPQPADATLLDLQDQAPTRSPTEIEPALVHDESPDPRPGSMQVTLLDTTDQNRALIVGSTIRDNGYECDEIRSALPVDRDGFNWRVNCGDARTYWIEIDEFGQLSARPMPYGDVEPPMFVPTVQPGERRTIELPTPE
jgi:hypothetical protein